MRRLLTIVAVLLLAPPAGAQEVTKRDRRGDVARSALDITRVTMSSDGKGLVIVDVTMAGNLERRIGRGALRRAAVGIGLSPAEGDATVVATSGSSKRPEAAKRGPGKVIVVNRDGRRVRFVVEGVATPERVVAVTLPRPSRSDLRARAAVDPFTLAVLKLVAERDLQIRARNDRMLMPGISQRKVTCAELRRLRGKLLDERSELVARRAGTEGAERQRVQEAINSLDIGVDRIEDEIALCTFLTPPGTTPPPPETFATSWAHGTGRSRICVYVNGAAGATGDVTVDGTDSPRTQPFTLDGNGRATVIFEISSYGTYPVGVRWGQPDGSSAVSNGTVTVDGNAGPAPPSGFAVCPPP